VRGTYSPTWVEIAITAGTVAYFVLLYMVFTKLFPIVSLWELKEGYRAEHVVPAVAAAPGAQVSYERT
jgi:molybdopterin-containing oxidoreductase family membrane subunit